MVLLSSICIFVCLIGRAISTGSKAAPAQTFPRQGVPQLKDTVAQFLHFSSILLPETEKSETKQIAKEFEENNEVKEFQRELEKRSQIQTMTNWLTPWWLDYGYLKARTPLPIVTSPGVTFPTRTEYSGPEGQLKHAAKVIHAALKYHHLILEGKVKEGRGQLDMSQYHLIYGTTRIPKHGKDELRFGKNQTWAHHIIVVRNGHSFHVPVYGTKGHSLSVDHIHSQLEKIIAESGTVNDFPINVCSSDERNKWAEVYERIKSNPKNQQSISSFENALFVIADGISRADGISDPPSADENMGQAIHGGGTDKNTINRWFDKALQLYVNINGSAGLTYEHTPADGPPLAMLADFVCDQFDGNHFNTEPNTDPVEPPNKLNFVLEEGDKKAISEASNKINKAAGNLEIVSIEFTEFGKDIPKAVGMSPDSFIQLALQLAYHNLHKTFACTYETGTLRTFAEGRTDTIRLPNESSAKFVKSMSPEHPEHSKRAQLLTEAAREHQGYSKRVMTGNGIDRHLLGLKILAGLEHHKSGAPMPALFSSKAYKRLSEFQLSTSQVPTSHVLPMGYGPSEADGYACCYNPQEGRIFFTITAFQSSSKSNAIQFSNELKTALSLMRGIAETIKPKPRTNS